MVLHLVTLSHTPESCGHRSAEARAVYAKGFGEITGIAARHEASIVGAWVNGAAHSHWLIVDAPTAHAVNTILGETGLLSHCSASVVAVEDFAPHLSPP